MNEFIVTSIVYNGKPYTAAALFEEGELAELCVEQAGRSSFVGCVYCGRVKSVSRGIGGCFISIGKAGSTVNEGILKDSSSSGLADCLFLHTKKGRNPQIGEKVLVQVTKDATGMKVAECTEEIRLAGKYLVIGPGPERLSFSRKLTDEQRAIVRKWIADAGASVNVTGKAAVDAASDVGAGSPCRILVRTNAFHARKDEFLMELDELKGKLEQILAEYQSAKGPKRLYSPETFYRVMERDLYVRPDRFFTDIPLLAERDPRYELRASVGRDLPLAEQYRLAERFNTLLAKRVPLDGGAFLVIEKTEAFVSVDVNSGSFAKAGTAEETHRRVNLTAAKVLAHEIRLRNLSGMILVDFINLDNPDHRKELIDTMRKLVKKDHVPTEVVDLTPLGIMEIVREKQRKPLAEILEG